jgi:hypothetical protein
LFFLIVLDSSVLYRRFFQSSHNAALIALYPQALQNAAPFPRMDFVSTADRETGIFETIIASERNMRR